MNREDAVLANPYAQDVVRGMVGAGRPMSEARSSVLSRYSWLVVDSENDEVVFAAVTEHEAEEYARKLLLLCGPDHPGMDLVRLP